MRKLVYATSLSLDGYIDSDAGDPSWMVPDEELHQHFNDIERQLGIDGCFKAFLPKPNLIIDDQALSEWRSLVHVHPAEASGKTIEDYRVAVYGDTV